MVETAVRQRMRGELVTALAAAVYPGGSGQGNAPVLLSRGPLHAFALLKLVDALLLALRGGLSV